MQQCRRVNGKTRRDGKRAINFFFIFIECSDYLGTKDKAVYNASVIPGIRSRISLIVILYLCFANYS